MLPDVFPLGPFIVQGDGRLAFRVPGCRPAFTFAWRGRHFAAVMAGDTVALTGTLGQIPSSLAAADRRQAAFETWRALPRGVPEGWSWRLTPEHRIELSAVQSMVWPATAAALIQPLVRFLLVLSPYMDFLEEAGLCQPGR